MGKDKSTKVEGTPRGLGLYRRQGREGFFFVKNSPTSPSSTQALSNGMDSSTS